jgi:hypothetical protein
MHGDLRNRLGVLGLTRRPGENLRVNTPDTEACTRPLLRMMSSAGGCTAG